MKAFNKTEICSLLSVAILCTATVYAGNTELHAVRDKDPVQQVVITAKRMSAEEKLADANAWMQTVVISAKRMTAAEKIAMDNETVLHVASKTATMNTTL